MNYDIKKFNSPVIEARERSVASLRNEQPDLMDSRRWTDLAASQVVQIVGTCASELLEEGILARRIEDDRDIRVGLEDTSQRVVSAEGYTEGSIGMFVNHAMAGLARNGYIKKG